VNARANIKPQTWTVGPFQELIFSVCMCVTKKWAGHITSSLAKRQRQATEEEETYLELTLKISKKNSKNVVYIFAV